MAFRTSTGKNQLVPTMRKNARTSMYAKFENFAALELAFGNGAFSLVVVLPDENADITSIVKQMDGDWWTQIIAGIEGPPYHFIVKMEIPRFKLEYERNLNDDLMVLGMKAPFNEKTADFSLISNKERLFISNIQQKTFAQMDEEGMKTASATVIEWAGMDNIEYTPVDFKVNRPFLYLIKEKSTSLVFFAGIMNSIH